jgi:hypothetical protein
MLNVLVPESSLQRRGVVASIGERVSAAMPRHVRVHWEWHFGPSLDPTE